MSSMVDHETGNFLGKQGFWSIQKQIDPVEIEDIF